MMVHLQLRRKNSNDRVLPVYYSDNYVSLAPNEARTITIDAALLDLKNQMPLVLVDGWNVSVVPVETSNAAVGVNVEAQVEHWPANGLAVVGATSK